MAVCASSTASRADLVRELGAGGRFAYQRDVIVTALRERGIVHLVLRDDSDLGTESEGMARDRHVVVYPKDYRPSGKAPRKTIP